LKDEVWGWSSSFILGFAGVSRRDILFGGVGLMGLNSVNIEGFFGLLPESVKVVFDGCRSELAGISVAGADRLAELRKIRDQWLGGKHGTKECYHPDQYGLNVEQQEAFRRVLRRSHVNLVEPALDRLVNSIHAGRIRRRSEVGGLAAWLRMSEHKSAMARLCENAFGYGTGFLVPSLNEGRVTYWLPDPLRSVLATNPADVSEVLGVIEGQDYGCHGGYRVRWVTGESYGVVWDDGRGDKGVEEEAHGLGFVPIVLAYGRDCRHQGEKYGRSLVGGVADASIRITNNSVNLELLRDRQTQALLVLQGQPLRTSQDDQESQGKYVQFPQDGGDARYETPESRLEQVIELSKRFSADAAVSSGLPLDTFLPELVAGSDASATAARIRAFPLQQRMSRLISDWEQVEVAAGVVVGAVGGVDVFGVDFGGLGFWQAAEVAGVSVSVVASLPEADAETLSNWQQRTANFFAPVEDAIEYYSPDVSEGVRADLVEAWKLKNDPRLSGEGELEEFKREIAKALYGGATTKEVMANLTNLRDLVDDVGLPRQEGYEEPWLPVVAPSGELVSGEPLLGGDGEVVGGDFLKDEA
jgi:hypothetical protein